MDELSRLKPPAGAVQKRKRVGRGPGSGVGKTAGHGFNGQKARSGGSIRPGFEGGQMPLQRRLPKHGFTNIFRTEYEIVNVSQLARFDADAVVDLDALVEKRLIKNTRRPVKLLGGGDVDTKLVVRVHKCSASAKAKIEKAGGTVEVIGG